jgi:hypothetical protein
MAKIDVGSAAAPRLPQSAASSPDHGDGQAADTDRSVPMVRGRVARRSVAASVTTLGILASVGVLNPMLGEIAVIIGLLVALTIIGTAQFGSPDLSDRAFRLLRWIGNRPEPPAPEASGTERAGRSRRTARDRSPRSLQ